VRKSGVFHSHRGNSLDLDLGKIWCSSFFSSSLNPLIALVALLEFESEGFEHISGVISIAFASV
jgi:hypothetical protein